MDNMCEKPIKTHQIDSVKSRVLKPEVTLKFITLAILIKSKGNQDTYGLTSYKHVANYMFDRSTLLTLSCLNLRDLSARTLITPNSVLLGTSLLNPPYSTFSHPDPLRTDHSLKPRRKANKSAKRAISLRKKLSKLLRNTKSVSYLGRSTLVDRSATNMKLSSLSKHSKKKYMSPSLPKLKKTARLKPITLTSCSIKQELGSKPISIGYNLNLKGLFSRLRKTLSVFDLVGFYPSLPSNIYLPAVTGHSNRVTEYGFKNYKVLSFLIRSWTTFDDSFLRNQLFLNLVHTESQFMADYNHDLDTTFYKRLTINYLYNRLGRLNSPSSTNKASIGGRSDILTKHVLASKRTPLSLTGDLFNSQLLFSDVAANTQEFKAPWKKKNRRRFKKTNRLHSIKFFKFTKRKTTLTTTPVVISILKKLYSRSSKAKLRRPKHRYFTKYPRIKLLKSKRFTLRYLLGKIKSVLSRKYFAHLDKYNYKKKMNNSLVSEWKSTTNLLSLLPSRLEKSINISNSLKMIHSPLEATDSAYEMQLSSDRATDKVLTPKSVMITKGSPTNKPKSWIRASRRKKSRNKTTLRSLRPGLTRVMRLLMKKKRPTKSTRKNKSLAKPSKYAAERLNASFMSNKLYRLCKPKTKGAEKLSMKKKFKKNPKKRRLPWRLKGLKQQINKIKMTNSHIDKLRNRSLFLYRGKAPSGSKLSKVKLSKTRLSRLSKLRLSKLRLSKLRLSKLRLSKLRLLKAKLPKTKLPKTKLSKTKKKLSKPLGNLKRPSSSTKHFKSKYTFFKGGLTTNRTLAKKNIRKIKAKKRLNQSIIPNKNWLYDSMVNRYNYLMLKSTNTWDSSVSNTTPSDVLNPKLYWAGVNRLSDLLDLDVLKNKTPWTNLFLPESLPAPWQVSLEKYYVKKFTGYDNARFSRRTLLFLQRNKILDKYATLFNLIRGRRKKNRKKRKLLFKIKLGLDGSSLRIKPTKVRGKRRWKNRKKYASRFLTNKGFLIKIPKKITKKSVKKRKKRYKRFSKKDWLYIKKKRKLSKTRNRILRILKLNKRYSKDNRPRSASLKKKTSSILASFVRKFKYGNTKVTMFNNVRFKKMINNQRKKANLIEKGNNFEGLVKYFSNDIDKLNKRTFRFKGKKQGNFLKNKLLKSSISLGRKSYGMLTKLKKSHVKLFKFKDVVRRLRSRNINPSNHPETFLFGKSPSCNYVGLLSILPQQANKRFQNKNEFRSSMLPSNSFRKKPRTSLSKWKRSKKSRYSSIEYPRLSGFTKSTKYGLKTRLRKSKYRPTLARNINFANNTLSSSYTNFWINNTWSLPEYDNGTTLTKPVRSTNIGFLPCALSSLFNYLKSFRSFKVSWSKGLKSTELINYQNNINSNLDLILSLFNESCYSHNKINSYSYSSIHNIDGLDNLNLTSLLAMPMPSKMSKRSKRYLKKKKKLRKWVRLNRLVSGFKVIKVKVSKPRLLFSKKARIKNKNRNKTPSRFNRPSKPKVKIKIHKRPILRRFKKNTDSCTTSTTNPLRPLKLVLIKKTTYGVTTLCKTSLGVNSQVTKPLTDGCTIENNSSLYVNRLVYSFINKAVVTRNDNIPSIFMSSIQNCTAPLVNNNLMPKGSFVVKHGTKSDRIDTKYSVKNYQFNQNYLSLFNYNLISKSTGFSNLLVLGCDMFSYSVGKRLSIMVAYLLANLGSKFKSLSTKFFIDETVMLILTSIDIKDPNMLMGWITQFMSKLHVKKHNLALAFIKRVLKKSETLGLLDKLKCSGVFIDIRGKIGVTGSKKKRHFAVYAGKYSSTNKQLRWASQKGLVYTSTGVLGVTVVIFY